jgi:hypothetical protein
MASPDVMMIHLILAFLGLSLPQLIYAFSRQPTTPVRQRQAPLRHRGVILCDDLVTTPPRPLSPQQDLNPASLSRVQGRAPIAQALESLRNLRSRLRDRADIASFFRKRKASHAT